jgi:hypothetical protein
MTYCFVVEQSVGIEPTSLLKQTSTTERELNSPFRLGTSPVYGDDDRNRTDTLRLQCAGMLLPVFCLHQFHGRPSQSFYLSLSFHPNHAFIRRLRFNPVRAILPTHGFFVYQTR